MLCALGPIQQAWLAWPLSTCSLRSFHSKAGLGHGTWALNLLGDEHSKSLGKEKGHDIGPDSWEAASAAGLCGRALSADMETQADSIDVSRLRKHSRDSREDCVSECPGSPQVIQHDRCQTQLRDLGGVEHAVCRSSGFPPGSGVGRGR